MAGVVPFKGEVAPFGGGGDRCCHMRYDNAKMMDVHAKHKKTTIMAKKTQYLHGFDRAHAFNPRLFFNFGDDRLTSYIGLSVKGPRIGAEMLSFCSLAMTPMVASRCVSHGLYRPYNKL